ncbi:hypothetical protein GCM10010156_70590 [Planobispora rosea]|uniref:Uncharacterized protein n=1 Tax=Planobispora rosea TaxID=35762 RepID=A0A8J3S886_PLARO|nr:hypothetical protein [Planobispora rosea]GGT02487.1 hypothetical protein GCM10010156_70590 [Planobispora rosea]GIH88530.1 hypothetical protein Pro02_69380 [Planobispora rosea]
MPLPVAIAATLQLLLAVTFLVIPVTVWFTGTAAQRAAEAEVARQGHSPDVLARHGIRFAERAWEFMLALTIAAILIVLAALNLTGSPSGRLLSWIAEPLILLGAGLITAGQVFATRYTQAAFKRSGDAATRAIDARLVIAAASSGFPAWLRPLVLARFALTVLGSLLVIILLAVPAAGAYFG